MDLARDKAEHVMPSGSPRLKSEALRLMPCTDSTLNVFDDRVEVISSVISRPSLGILYKDLRRIVYTAPVALARGSIELLRSVGSSCNDSSTTVWFKHASEAPKCLQHVRTLRLTSTSLKTSKLVG